MVLLQEWLLDKTAHTESDLYMVKTVFKIIEEKIEYSVNQATHLRRVNL